MCRAEACKHQRTNPSDDHTRQCRQEPRGMRVGGGWAGFIICTHFLSPFEPSNAEFWDSDKGEQNTFTRDGKMFSVLLFFRQYSSRVSQHAPWGNVFWETVSAGTHKDSYEKARRCYLPTIIDADCPWWVTGSLLVSVAPQYIVGLQAPQLSLHSAGVRKQDATLCSNHAFRHWLNVAIFIGKTT